MSKDLRTVENETLNNIIHMAAEAMQLKAGSIDRRVITEEIADSALCIRHQFNGSEVEKIRKSTTCSKLYDCISQYQDYLKDTNEENHKHVAKVRKIIVKWDTKFEDEVKSAYSDATALECAKHMCNRYQNYYSINVVSDMIGVSEDIIKTWIKRGEITDAYEYSSKVDPEFVDIRISFNGIISFLTKCPEYIDRVKEYFYDNILSHASKETRKAFDLVFTWIALYLI